MWKHVHIPGGDLHANGDHDVHLLLEELRPLSSYESAKDLFLRRLMHLSIFYFNRDYTKVKQQGWR